MITKMKYSIPELIDLSLKSVKGDCTSGTGDVALCQPGTNAQNDCVANGTNATASCNADGNSPALCLAGANF